MTYQVIIPVLVAFAITAVLGPVIIPFLRKLKIGNTEREELESHQKKNGTPTMGGIMILIAVVVTSLFYVKDYPQIIPVLFVTVGFGIIGFLDDYLKVVLRRSDGLLAWQKMLCEIVVTAVFAVYLIKHQVSLDMIVPFSHHMSAVVLAGSADSVSCSHRYRKRRQLYRRSGWSGFQRDHSGRYLFLRSCICNRSRYRTGDLCRSRRIAWILII